MIIGFCGNMQAGKDTAAAYLISEHNFQRRAFADKLKQFVAAIFEIDFADIDRYKNDPSVRIVLANIVSHMVHPGESSFPIEAGFSLDRVICKRTFREFLKFVGTEGGRDVLGQDLWVDLVLPKDGFYAGKKIVVTDVRFQNEVDRIVSLGGLVCRIKRPILDSKDPHRSEQSMLLNDVGYEIVNDSSIDDLYQQVSLMVSQFEELKGERI